MKALLGVANRGALRTSVVLLLGAFLQAQSSQSLKLPNPLVTHNASGQLSTYTTSKFIDTANPFFPEPWNQWTHMLHLPRPPGCLVDNSFLLARAF